MTLKRILNALGLYNIRDGIVAKKWIHPASDEIFCGEFTISASPERYSIDIERNGLISNHFVTPETFNTFYVGDYIKLKD